ncbi:MAG: hypothetical protein OJF49_002710 [Ktedonobacterales bacterium]|jgi:DNA-binding transcriptional ArsR family regulator|nr:MAG: hypothetical protein OJF49_002710 [Ktedonobacterales bacterium]
MSPPAAPTTFDANTLLPDSVPVDMPELPPCRAITTAEQFKVFADPVRRRILGIIQTSPATAKQIANRLNIAPGSVGHHLQMLEAAGLAQVVARRIVRGIVAKYYTRTARVFTFAIPADVIGERPFGVGMLHDASNELAEAIAALGEPIADITGGFPHARISPERAQAYKARIDALIDDFVREPHDPNGQVFGLAVSLYTAPPYLQGDPPAPTPSASSPAEPNAEPNAEPDAEPDDEDRAP